MGGLFGGAKGRLAPSPPKKLFGEGLREYVLYASLIFMRSPVTS